MKAAKGNDAAQRPQDRRPCSGSRALVDRDRVDEVVDRDEEQHRHGRQEEQDERNAVDHALGSIRECFPQHVGAHVRALEQRQGGSQHEQRRIRHRRDIEGPDRRVLEDVAGEHLDHVGQNQRNDEQHEQVASPLREFVDGADDSQIASGRHQRWWKGDAAHANGSRVSCECCVSRPMGRVRSRRHTRRAARAALPSVLVSRNNGQRRLIASSRANSGRPARRRAGT